MERHESSLNLPCECSVRNNNILLAIRSRSTGFTYEHYIYALFPIYMLKNKLHELLSLISLTR
jgi:hypothetical protein